MPEFHFIMPTRYLKIFVIKKSIQFNRAEDHQHRDGQEASQGRALLSYPLVKLLFHYAEHLKSVPKISVGSQQ